MPIFTEVIEAAGQVVEGAGVLVIIAGLAIATGRFALAKSHGTHDKFRQYRQDLGRAILLGLEFLVAGDIIRTVAVSPDLRNVLVLGLIVLIRTFLSMSLQLELEGRWPWQRRNES